MGGWKEISGPDDDDTAPWRDTERYFRGRIVSYKGKRYKFFGVENYFFFYQRSVFSSIDAKPLKFTSTQDQATGGFINAAKPGNRRDKIFAKLFGPSLMVYTAIVMLQLTIVATQLFLMHNAHWDRLIALCLEQFHGYFNLFRIVRNWLAGKFV